MQKPQFMGLNVPGWKPAIFTDDYMDARKLTSNRGIRDRFPKNTGGHHFISSSSPIYK